MQVMPRKKCQENVTYNDFVSSSNKTVINLSRYCIISIQIIAIRRTVVQILHTIIIVGCMYNEIWYINNEHLSTEQGKY